ncbi:transporter substrate-binding domain-containing protein [Arenimonas donghaensis]|uniref:Solute-binding protein family 3/N-terminal domain-containing protein n=1 Tax=Arenimonas donghaensis DSM 18148 = HO3-R19 TaxID=1121014 RepID=A0A087MLJ4_9GAMM|nr:transporter substrate-binding domain-containing protein [Arenimonas donghaensis]KFL37747.1 hypothetical protein N788_00835 [Arenimonas donghaensis DSM 18148 = HO3-R19]
MSLTGQLRRLAGPALLLVASATLAQPTLPVRVGGDPHYPPHHYLDVDGQAQGFDMAVLRSIGETQSLALVFEFGEWGQVLDRLERGELDVVPMFISEDRQERFLFSRPFMRRSHLLFSRNGEWIEDPAQLAGRRVAVQFGGMAWEWLINERVDAMLHPVNEESLVLVEVRRGDADFALLPADIGRYAIATQGLEGLAVASPPWLERDYAFGVNPARPELVARLDAGLARLEQEGGLEAQRQRWLDPSPSGRQRGGLGWWLLPAVPVLLAGLVYLVAGRRAQLRKPR